MEDTFFDVKDDIEAALSRANDFCDRFVELCKQTPAATHQEKEWLSTELRNTLRSIEWDLEDLEETVRVLERTPKRYRLSNDDVAVRRKFVIDIRAYVQDIRDRMASVDPRFKHVSPFKNNVRGQHDSSASSGVPLHASYKYSKLRNDDDNNDRQFITDTYEKQQLIMQSQDDNLERIGDSVHVLKDMSHRIGGELDEQAIMLDDLGQGMERTHSRLDTVMKKLAKVTRMSNDKRQWYAIGILLVVLFIVILLLIIL